MFWGRPPLRGGARQPALPVECFTMSRLRPAGRRQPATINPPVSARKLWRCGAEAEMGEGEGKLSPESFPSPSPNPTPFPSKTFVNGAGGGSGGLAARALLEVPRSRPPVPGISPDCAGWFRRLSGRPSASGFQPRSGITLICVGRSPASGVSDASLFLGLPDVASCIRQQFVGVVPKDEWGRFSEPGISPDCAGWFRRLLGHPVSGILASCASVSLLHSGVAPVPGILPGTAWVGSMMYCCWPCIRHSAALSGIARCAAVIGGAVFWGHVLFFRLLWRHRALINPRLSPVRDRHGRRA